MSMTKQAHKDPGPRTA